MVDKYCIDCGIIQRMAGGMPCKGSGVHGRFVTYEKYLERHNVKKVPVVDYKVNTPSVGRCMHCESANHPLAADICSKSPTGKHVFEAVPAHTHTHNLVIGGHTHSAPLAVKSFASLSATDIVMNGMHGWSCPQHKDNFLSGTCRACTYAVSQGGVIPGWADKNLGSHTMAIPIEIPENYCMPEVKSAWDNQVGGKHYHAAGGIQPFHYAMANNLNSLEFSVVKYLRKKGDKAKRLEDLRKARDCLDKLIEWEEKDGNIKY